MPGWKSLDPEFTTGPRLTGGDQEENGPSCLWWLAKTTVGPYNCSKTECSSALQKSPARHSCQRAPSTDQSWLATCMHRPLPPECARLGTPQAAASVPQLSWSR